MMKTVECEAVLSDQVLNAARAVLQSPVAEQQIQAWAIAGNTKNQPLLPLLICLLDASKAVASAVADNAWDDCQPIASNLAADLSHQAIRIADDIRNATQCPSQLDLGLPSMTKKELV